MVMISPGIITLDHSLEAVKEYEALETLLRFLL
jgi:hypothetical protein